MRALRIVSVAGAVTVQDHGRAGWLAFGLSQGGAADPVALAEGAALLGQSPEHAALELMSAAARIAFDQPTRIALTGAPMRANVTEGDTSRPLAWNSSHALPAGAEIALAPGPAGGFGYLHIGGGIEAPLRLGARAVHLAGGLGAALQSGDRLALGPDEGGPADLTLDPLPRFGGGTLRAVETMQTRLYDPAEIARLQSLSLRRNSHGNRMGVRLDLDGAEGFMVEGGLSVVSEIVQPGDIQITGDGTPFVLMSECQTTGGYPRIATVLACDLPIVAQAPHGAALRIAMIDRASALAALRRHAEALAGLPRHVRPRLRAPSRMTDLLAYNLVSGVVDATRPDHFDHHLAPAQKL